ncbi:MAG: hypothetical protein IPP98_10185 [Gemmatimonadetes bacterium]|nr:hypothetical protein [Gemmatimonadota bacterium]
MTAPGVAQPNRRRWLANSCCTPVVSFAGARLPLVIGVVGYRRFEPRMSWLDAF